ncbi:MAG: hypothetical protein ABI720_03705 [Actinomycetes bacterium]
MSTAEPPGPPDPWQPPGEGVAPPPPPPPPPPMAGYPPAYPSAAPTAGYGQPPAGVSRTSGKSTAVLILGISSLVLICAIFAFLPVSVVPAIIALALAPGAKREINQSAGAVTGLGAVKAGVICSWVAIGVSVAFFALIVGLFALGTATESSFETTSDSVSEGGVALVGLVAGMPLLVRVRCRLRATSPRTTKEI